MMIDDIKNSRKRRRSPSPENLHQAKRAAVAQAHLNGTSKCEKFSFTETSFVRMIPISILFSYFVRSGRYGDTSKSSEFSEFAKSPTSRVIGRRSSGYDSGIN